MTKFTEFLWKYKTVEGFSHVSMANPRGKFMIDKSDPNVYKEFIKLLCEDDNERGIGEKFTEMSPVTIDIDLSVPLDLVPEDLLEDTPKLYDSILVDNVVSVYQDCLQALFVITDQRQLTACILTKDPYIDNEVVKHGFHISFPFAYLNYTLQNRTLRIKVIELLEERKVFPIYQEHRLKIKINKTLNEIVDEIVLPNRMWLMYGSSKGGGKKPYLLERILNHDLVEYKEPLEVFANVINDNLFVKNGSLTLEGEGDFSRYLPFLLSLDAWEDLFGPIKLKDYVKGPEAKKRVFPIMKSNESPEDIKQLLKMLRDSRAHNRKEWIEVGWTIFNITNGSQAGLDFWDKFSERSRKYKKGICYEEWDNMRPEELGMGSLRYWAKIDSPEEYLEWKKTKVNNDLLSAARSRTNQTIANLFKTMYGDEFICSNVKNSTWYQFTNHRWRIVDDATSIYNLLSGPLYKRFNDELLVIDNICHELRNNKSPENDQQYLQEEAKRVDFVKVLKSLEQHAFKQQVIKTLSNFCHDMEFSRKLDADDNLICFNNGVYDLDTGSFRDGDPKDRMTKCTNINYREYLPDSAEVQEVRKYLGKVFVDSELYTYFLRYASTILQGGNKTKKLPFWSGEGDNSKSVLVDLFMKSFGDYAIKLPTSMLQSKRSGSSSCTPELERMPGVRLCFIQEPAADEPVNISILKEMTGNDTFYSRGLYKSGGDIKPQFKIIVMCNTLLKINSAEKAVWTRVRVVPFESTFTNEDCPVSIEEQYAQKIFPRDNYFDQKINGMIAPFMWLLIEEFKKYKLEGIAEPKIVTAASEKYRMENDICRQYYVERICKEKGSTLTIKELYADYVIWFRTVYNAAPQDRTIFKKEFSKFFKGAVSGEKFVDIALNKKEVVDN